MVAEYLEKGVSKKTLFSLLEAAVAFKCVFFVRFNFSRKKHVNITKVANLPVHHFLSVNQDLIFYYQSD